MLFPRIPLIKILSELADPSVDIPEFQITFNLKDASQDLPDDDQIIDIVQGFVNYMEPYKHYYPYPRSTNLMMSQPTFVIDDGSTFVASFAGHATFRQQDYEYYLDPYYLQTNLDKYYDGPLSPEEVEIQIKEMMLTIFEDGYGRYFNKYMNAHFQFSPIESGDGYNIAFVPATPDNDSSPDNLEGIGDEDPGDGNDNSGESEGYGDEPSLGYEGEDNDEGNVGYDSFPDSVGEDTFSNQKDTPTTETKVIQGVQSSPSKISISLLVGLTALIASLALFSYAYKKRNQAIGYRLSEDHEHDLEAQATPEEEHGVNVIKSLGLSDIAATTPAHTGQSYLGAAAKAWSATRRTMSDLAAGATQEEFFKNGMNIHVYGSQEKNRAKKQKRNSPKASEMEPLEAIIEVDSLNSGTNTDTESWQQGNQEINRAPPLLPALSISSTPSDETPLNDIRNMVDEFASPAPPSEDYDISFNTPLETPTESAMGIGAMTPYADMTGITGSPNMTNSSNGSSDDGLPLNTMRCLSFDAARSVSDFSSSDQSSGSCVKDMLEAIDPNNSESSSDGCVKDMLMALDSCASPRESEDEQSIEKPKESRTKDENTTLDENVKKELEGESPVQDTEAQESKAQEDSFDLTYSDDESSPQKLPKEENSMRDTPLVESTGQEEQDESIDLTYSDDEKSPAKQPQGQRSLSDIGLQDVDLFCPPEIKTHEGKIVMNDVVSGTTTRTDDSVNMSNPPIEGKSEDGERNTECSLADDSDAESTTSLITIEQNEKK